MSPRSRLHGVIAAANAAADDPAVRAELEATSALSAAGVRLALDECLERAPSEAELDSMVRSARPATGDVTVILAANVFVGALRAIAFAAVGAERVHVRASRREPTFARALVHHARTLGASWLDLDESRDLATIRDAAHVYGRAGTVAEVRRGVPPTVAVYAHGPGFSAAWIDAHEDLAAAARAVAADMIPFDQRGCLSPRITFVQGHERAAEFVARLDEALRTTPIARGHLDEGERAEWQRYVDTWTMAAHALYEGPAHAVVLDAGNDLVLAPVGRAMHVQAVQSGAAALERLAPVWDQLVALAGAPLSLPPTFARVRCTRLGLLQRPAFDGPVDLRVLA